LRSIQNLPGVAGVLVSNERDLVFTSNRGEKTISLFHHGQENNLDKIRVGGFPNGLAYDPSRDSLLAANVSRPDDPNPITISMVDARKKVLVADIIVPGRTRWTIYDAKSDRFFVNISKPSQIVAIESNDPDGISARYDIPATGPHGLDIDPEGRILFCACDQEALFTVDLRSGKVAKMGPLTGPPDVIFYNKRLNHLYVAIGDPGVIDVYDTKQAKLVETVKTERGAHTIAYSQADNKVYAFLPETHRASIYVDD
jgi:DNA-binding beta-propeller fold protein YncE